MTLFPICTWDVVPNAEADAALVRWGHWLGPCDRPFCVQSFGLFLAGELVAVAVSASTCGVTCGGYERKSVVELARLCAHPDHRDLTRVAIRLWRKTAPAEWALRNWPCVAVVSYSNAVRHTGNVYRLDGWRRVADVPGGVAGGGHQKGTRYDPKSVWAFDLK